MNEEEGIRRTLAEYCQHVDDHEFDKFCDLFTEDMQWHMTGVELRTRDGLRAWTAETFADPDLRAHHMVTNSVIQIDGDTATATSDFFALVRSPSGPVVASVGRYFDVFRREADRWRFADHTIVIEPEWMMPPPG